MSNSSILLIDRGVSGAITSSHSGPGSDEGILSIPQPSIITTTLSSDWLMSYSGHSLVESYPSAEMQSVYSTETTDWAYMVLCHIQDGALVGWFLWHLSTCRFFKAKSFFYIVMVWRARNECKVYSKYRQM